MEFTAATSLKTFGNIVITVPNTFNQTHKTILTDLFKKYITWDIIPDQYKPAHLQNKKSSLFFDEVKFISESDSVAYYYLKEEKKYDAGWNGS